eukprot:3279268-Amphidinium_carterae.1
MENIAHRENTPTNMRTQTTWNYIDVLANCVIHIAYRITSQLRNNSYSEPCTISSEFYKQIAGLP